MRNKGWTLIEALVVVVLMGIILAIGIPQYGRYISRTQLESASNEVLAALRVARSNAISEQKTYRVFFNKTANTYRMIPGGGEKTLPGGIEISNSVDITYEFNADRTAVVDPSNIIITNSRGQTVEFSVIAATGYIEVEE